MTNDIPKIDDLLDGINDSEDILEKPSATPQETVEAPPTEENESPADASSQNDEKCWNSFMTVLDQKTDNNERDDRLVCKIDRDLADSLDDCDIGNRCRSDLVNAIVRAFFETYLTKLLKYRREKKSLFRKFKGN